jgi:hypothetical protein
VIAASAIAVLVVLIALVYRAPEPEVVELAPTPTPPPTPAPRPTAVATPAAIPTETVEIQSNWIVASTLEPTPTPWPTAPPPVRREPSPTPALSECVVFRWSTVQVFIPSAQVLTEIRAENRCNRDIEPLDVIFEVSGWRDGGLVRSVRARPFDRIRRRHSEIISVGLPGSLDWYDQITVEIVE